MKFLEAMKLLLAGKKVRGVNWEKKYFLSVDQKGKCENIALLSNSDITSDWELYEEKKPQPTLDEIVKRISDLEAECASLREYIKYVDSQIE